MQTSLSLLLAFVVPLLALPARADESPAPRGRTSSLSWIRLHGAESCVATQRLAQAVEERLGRPVFVSAAQADVSVEGHIERGSEGRWQATVSVRDAGGALLGTRNLESREASCEALTDELAFVVAVMIDPDAANGPKPAPAPAPTPPPPPPAPPPRVVVIHELTPAPAEPQPWRFEVEAAAALGLGVVPGAGPGVTLAAVLEPPHFWAVRASGSYFFDASVDVAQGARATFSLAYGELLLCPLHRGFGRARVLACAGGQAGSLRSTGAGFPTSASDEALEVNLAAEGQVMLTLVKPLVAMAGVTVLVPTMRERLTYTHADGSSEEIFRAAPVGGVGEIGLGVYFP